MKDRISAMPRDSLTNGSHSFRKQSFDTKQSFLGLNSTWTGDVTGPVDAYVIEIAPVISGR